MDIRKEANRLHWMVKGSLLSKDISILGCKEVYNTYFVRLWGNDEAYTREEGFDEAWKQRNN